MPLPCTTSSSSPPHTITMHHTIIIIIKFTITAIVIIFTPIVIWHKQTKDKFSHLNQILSPQAFTLLILFFLVPYPQAESSSETKSLLLLKNQTKPPSSTGMVLSYKECLKNHAASLGGHALDGCGEFMPTPSATPTDPSSFKCAACGCHRNFHRRHPYDAPPFIHRLPPPRSPSPTHSPSSPVPYSYYPSAPHMLLALSNTYSGQFDEHRHHLNKSNPSVPRINNNNNNNDNPSGKKRSRTKFTKEQKDKMHAFAEKLGWKMQRSEERLIQEFCYEIGVDRTVLKVWMHNNKNNCSKKDRNLNLHDNNNNEDNGNALHSNNGSSSAS